jgi:hypothetical protein
MESSVIQACRNVDIVRLIARSVPLTRRGGEYVTLCPFHSERTPSMTVIPKKNAFYCFGCAIGGSPIDWVMKYEQRSFREAVDRICELENVDVTSPRYVPVHAELRLDRTTVLRGRRNVNGVLPLDQDQWLAWHEARTGSVDRFAEARGLSGDVLRNHDVVDVGPEWIGFTYFNPETGEPCMVKVRSVEGKKFFLAPRPPKEPDQPDVNARALMPVYLGHDLRLIPQEAVQVVTITEGEVDALTLRSAGLRNVVSLPQGAGSAKHVDLMPLFSFTAWLISTDTDTEGENAANVLRARARSIGVDAIRVRWTRSVSGVLGDEVVIYKDANDMLKDGATPDDFLRCARAALQGYFMGLEPKLTEDA